MFNKFNKFRINNEICYRDNGQSITTIKQILVI